MKAVITGILPAYAYGPLFLVVAVNFLVYIGARKLTAGRKHFSLWMAVDDHIPFQTGFVVFYVLAFAQWVIGYILIGRESASVCVRYCTADIVAKLVSFACFMLLPTYIDRPEVKGSSPFDALTRFIFRVDAADNLFPSIHCLESWMCFRSSLVLLKVPGWYMPLTLVVTLLVFASTVCLKQHVFVDIIGGIAAVEIGLLAAGLLL